MGNIKWCAEKELAVIRNPHFGNRCIGKPFKCMGKPCLWFDAKTLTGSSRQVLCGAEMLQFVDESDVADIQLLDGKGIAVIEKGLGGPITVVRPFEFC